MGCPEEQAGEEGSRHQISACTQGRCSRQEGWGEDVSKAYGEEGSPQEDIDQSCRTSQAVTCG